jgi:halimadienyl-diphosphate synthase
MEFRELLADIGPLQVSPSAYDTAWLARMNSAIGQRAHGWLVNNQLADGSWGAAEPTYYHDRFISTLSAIATLLQTGFEPDSPAIKRAKFALDRNLKGLAVDPSGATVGFELIVPTLIQECRALGVYVEGSLLERLVWARTAKLSSLPNHRIDRRFTPSFSAEAVGRDHLHLLDADSLQAPNGSVAFSPSATAFFAEYVRPDPAALAYLSEVIGADGAVPYVGPIEVFDRGWALWNLSLLPDIADELEAEIDTHVEVLRKEWRPGKGIASAIGLPLLDGDDTAVVLAALRRLGHDLDLEGVLAFKTTFNFRCYPLESDPSTSTNVHVLDALRVAGLTAQHPAVQTALTFLRRTQTDGMFWLDKWHASPLYPTSHAVIALMDLDNTLAERAIDWILATQRPSGAWGWYQPTAEETAYALQALSLWGLRYNVPRNALERGYAWLQEHQDPPYPPLWIGKCLYTPSVPVMAAIISARHLAKRVLD